jgi:hypothetical protein
MIERLIVRLNMAIVEFKIHHGYIKAGVVKPNGEFTPKSSLASGEVKICQDYIKVGLATGGFRTSAAAQWEESSNDITITSATRAYRKNRTTLGRGWQQWD